MLPLAKLLSLLSIFAAASCQSVDISSPVPNQNLTAGSPFLVTLDSSDGLTGFQDVSVAIGILTCGSEGPCSNSSTPMVGTVLYSGDFNPQRSNPAQPASQNFTLDVPSTMQGGNALLTVSHFYLIGAGMEPVLEVKNQTVSISSGQ